MSAASYKHIQVAPSGPVGAEVSGVDLSQALSDSVRYEIHSAWLEHHVLFFRDQNLTPSAQAAFAENFGALDVYPFMKALDSHPNVIPIIKEPEAKTNFGGGWHTDTSYMSEPPKATLLYAVEVPTSGGDTLFADASKAYEELSSGMKKMVDGMIGIYSAKIVHGQSGAYDNDKIKTDLGDAYGGEAEIAEREVEHPVIRTHPETSHKSIFASLAHTHRIKDMTREESLPIIDYLARQVTKPEHVTQFRWTRGALAMWDNRCLFHKAKNDYHGQRRHMHRVIVKGDRPF
ncbi:MAG TPA: TauD/TfdA family dioxygenase [Steroidobacteraceae bacterium]|nr:TauD/TfdA family dioxygenase [Steroidobacteraceae bacterium]